MRRTIREIMVTDLVRFKPQTNIHAAIHTLLAHGYSGAPVVDDGGALVGMLSKRDCLKVVFSTAYHQDRGGPVSEYMSADVQTLAPDLDLVSCAKRFLDSPFRRFPIVENGQLIGQVSRHDILKSLSEDLKRN